MARSKKTRKIGQIGVRKDPDFKRVPNTASGKPKKRKGNAAGSRHSAAQDQATSAQQAKRDPRVGSKKPIPLVVEKSQPVEKTKYFTPAQELKAIEDDKKLSKLLDKLDAGRKVSADEQAYVDAKLARHRILCDLLGVDNEEEQQEDTFSDPLSDFEEINIDDFK